VFEAQINYIWSLKNSKWVKSYMLLLFILYVVLISPKIVYIVVCFHPFTIFSDLSTNVEKLEKCFLKCREFGISLNP
jgi:uncharacterized membrane protein